MSQPGSPFKSPTVRQSPEADWSLKVVSTLSQSYTQPSKTLGVLQIVSAVENEIRFELTDPTCTNITGGKIDLSIHPYASIKGPYEYEWTYESPENIDQHNKSEAHQKNVQKYDMFKSKFRDEIFDTMVEIERFSSRD